MSVDYYLNSLRDNLYKYLREKDCSMLSLSKQCDISDKALGHILHRERDGIRLVTIVKISHGTVIPISVLIGEEKVSAS